MLLGDVLLARAIVLLGDVLPLQAPAPTPSTGKVGAALVQQARLAMRHRADRKEAAPSNTLAHRSAFVRASSPCGQRPGGDPYVDVPEKTACEDFLQQRRIRAL